MNDYSYQEIKRHLRISYNLKAWEREGKEISGWKAKERSKFLSLLKSSGKRSLLEIGSGVGVHGKFFSENGIHVICLDLSIENLKLCQLKNLPSIEMDVSNLGFPRETIESAFALNCLLHIPIDLIDNVINEVNRILLPEGLFYWGQYGGINQAGRLPEDHYEPKRYFSFLSDSKITKFARKHFQIREFATIQLEGETEFHFQSLILAKQ